MELYPALIDFAQALIIGGIATLSFNIYEYIKKKRAFSQFDLLILNKLTYVNCNVNSFEAESDLIQINADFLKLTGELHELQTLIDSINTDDTKNLNYELMERISKLRTTFLILCNDLHPSERKDILEGLYNQKSELNQTKYMLEILNNVLDKTKKKEQNSSNCL